MAEAIKKFERFHNYDYSRGCTIFITFTLGWRLPLLGRVEGDRVVLSAVGEVLSRRFEGNAIVIPISFG